LEGRSDKIACRKQESSRRISRGTQQQHAAGGATQAALEAPQKRDKSQYFELDLAPTGSFPPVPIYTHLGFPERRICGVRY